MEYSVVHNGFWEDFSDHRPISSNLVVLGGRRDNMVLTKPVPRRQKKILKLARVASGKTCPEEKERNVKQMERWVSTTKHPYWWKVHDAAERRRAGELVDWESDEWSGFNAAFWNCNGLDGDGGLAKLALAMRWMQRKTRTTWR